jgi:hypothetical protein
MNILPLLLQVAALICFGIAAMPKNWGWWGAFLTVLSLMVSGIVLHPIH